MFVRKHLKNDKTVPVSASGLEIHIVPVSLSAWDILVADFWFTI